MIDDLAEILNRLTSRIDQLEQRVGRLEHSSDEPVPAPDLLPVLPPHASAATAPLIESSVSFAVLGKAMLGLAGAYVLRAVAESGAFPQSMVAAIAIIYALLWLLASVRGAAAAWFTHATYAVTSALILGPMLWELTLRFGVLPAGLSAALIAVFAAAAAVLSWKQRLTSVVLVAISTAGIAAIALAVAAHDPLPFTWALILSAGLLELAALANRWIGIRPVAAFAADAAIALLLFFYAREEAANFGATQLLLAAGALLFVYLVAVSMRTILFRQTMSVFESLQTLLAFAFVAEGIHRFAPGTGAAAFAWLCIAASLACYTLLFFRFHPVDERRNYQIFGTWGLGLLLLGSFHFLDAGWTPAILGAAAIFSTSLGVSASRIALGFHGLTYLIAAAFAAELHLYAAHALAGAFPPPPLGVAWILCGAALVCYVVNTQIDAANWKARALQLSSAVLASIALAVFLVSAMMWTTKAFVVPGPHHVAIVRTLAGCLIAIVAAFIAYYWGRLELRRLAYGTLAVLALKLLLEDMRTGRAGFIALSIVVYALTLILVPRILRKARRLATSTETEPATIPIGRAANQALRR